MRDLAGKVRELGLAHVQLALGDLIVLDENRQREELDELRAAGIQFTGGMMAFAGEDYSSIHRIRQTGGYVSAADWPERKRLSIEGAKLAQRLGIKTITSHIGFVPPPGDASYKPMLLRIRELAGEFSRHGVDLLMETGQEPAGELLAFLNDLAAPNVHINFDPANMILYGAGDPIEAIRLLGRHIRHVHVKDATPSARPGIDWGAEVPFGAGIVGASRFVHALAQIGYSGPLAIEREAGNDRMGDVNIAIQTLQKTLG